MALVREVHRDAQASVGDLPRQPRRGDDDVELRLELGQDLRHEIGRVPAREGPLERQALEELAGRVHLAERVQAVLAARDPPRHDLDDRRVALEPQVEAPAGSVADGGARQDHVAGDLDGSTVERDLGAARGESLEEVPHAGARDDLARGRPEEAIDAHVLVRGREVGERARAGPVRGERLAEALFAAVAVDDRPRRGQEPVLAAEAVHELRRRCLRRRSREGLALLGRLRRGDDRGRDVHARVDLVVAVARPLAGIEVERHRGGHGPTGSAHAERELAAGRPGEGDGAVARELHPLRPHAGQARLANGLQE